LGLLAAFAFGKAKSQPKGLAVVQSHSQKQLLPSTNLKAPQTLLSPAFGSKITHLPLFTLVPVRFFSLFFHLNASLPSSREILTAAPSVVPPVVAPMPGSTHLRRPPPSPCLAPIPGPSISPCLGSSPRRRRPSVSLQAPAAPGPGGRIHDGELDRHWPTQLRPLPA
jgi:hypothetical protein